MRSHSGIVAATWTPASAPGLKVDFDPGRLALADGANVTSLTDSSGNGNNASTLVGTAPTFSLSDSTFNNKPSVVFGGAGKLHTAAFGTPLATSTIFVVYSQNLIAAGGNVFDGISGDNVELVAGATTEEIYAGAAIFNRFAFFPLAPNCRSINFNGASGAVYQDGLLQVSGNLGTHSMDGVTVGGYGSGVASLDAVMRLARMLIYSPALGDSDRQAAEKYLMAQYALPSVYTRKVIYSGGLGCQDFPGLALLANGDLLAFWDDGTTLESSTDYQVDMARSTNGGKTWTVTTNIYTERSTPGMAGTQLGASQLASGRILVPIQAWQPTPPNNPASRTLKSDDNGATWAVLSTNGLPAGYVSLQIYGQITEPVAGGTLYVPAYGALAGHSFAEALLLKSADHGTTWTLQGRVIPTDDANGYSETSAAWLGGSNWLAISRKDVTTPLGTSLWVTSSTNNGATWSAATEVAAGTGGVSPCLLRLSSGNVLLLAGSRLAGKGVFGMLSTDGGATWGTARWVYQSPVASPVGYPAAVQKANGVIVVVWTGDVPSGNPVILAQGFDESFFQ